MDKKLYLAKYDDEVLAVIISDSYDKAQICFTSAEIDYNQIEEIDIDNVTGIGGVTFVCKRQITTHGNLWMKRGF